MIRTKEYYSNGFIKSLIIRPDINKSHLEKYDWISITYNYDNRILNLINSCDIIEKIDDDNNIYSIHIKYYNNNTIKCIQWKKNGFLHNEHISSLITYHENEKIQSIASYLNGNLINYDNNEILDIDEWWKYNSSSDKPSATEFNNEENIHSYKYINNVYFCIKEFYYNTKNIKYEFKFKNDNHDMIHTILYDYNQIRVSESWTLNGGYHNDVNDNPALIIYYMNDRIKQKEWWKNGILSRDNNKPVRIEYYQTSVLLCEEWNNNDENKPTKIYYYESGNKKSEQYWKNGKLHRDNDLPAIIEYYDTKEQNIKYEEWWIGGKRDRDNFLFTKIKYNIENGIQYIKWIIYDINAYIVDIHHEYNINNILNILSILYIHQDIGSPKLGLYKFLVNTFKHQNIINIYNEQIINICNIYSKKFPHYECFIELLYVPPKNNFIGGLIFHEIKNDISYE